MPFEVLLFVCFVTEDITFFQYTFTIMGGTFTYKGMEDEENLFSLRDLDYNVMGELHVNRNPPTINKHIYLKVSPNHGAE